MLAMRRNPILVAVAAALALLILWLLAADRGASDAATASARGQSAPRLAGPDPLGEDSRAPQAGLDSARSATSLDPSPTDADASEEPPKRGVELVPIRGAARTRVADVELWWWPEAERSSALAGSKFEQLVYEGELDAHFAEHAKPLAPDEFGRFFSPCDTSPSTGFVVASSPGWWGYAFVHNAEPSPCYVELVRDTNIDVRVVDAAGSPVRGVRVGVRDCYGGGAYYDHVRARTDEEGRAVLRHVAHAIGDDTSFGSDLRILIAETLATDASVPLDLERWPTAPVELVMPTTGAVEVALVDWDFAASPDAPWVSLVTAARDASENAAVPRYVLAPRQVVDGAVLFPFVEIGCDVVASARCPETGWRCDFVRGRGPARPGETVRLELRMREPALLVRGRLVHEDGSAAGDAEFGCALAAPERSDRPAYAREGLRTDADGGFQLLASVRLPAELQFEVVVRDARGRPAERGTRALRSRASAGVLEVGDVRLAPLPVLAAGVVLDAAGQPVAFASVEVHEPMGPSGDGADAPVGWSPRWRDEGRTDAQGRFRIASDCASPSVALWVKCGDRRGTPREVRTGDEHVVLTLDWSGVIAGRVVLPQGVYRQQVTLKAVARDSAPVAIALREWRRRMLDDSSEFAIRGLESGAYDVVVEVDGAEDPIARVENVHVISGEITRDARLNPLDLRESVDLVTVRVLDLDGRPVQYGDARWSDAEADGGVRSNWFSNGWLRLSRSLTTPNVWIASEGRMLTAVDPATVGEEVRLRPAQPVRVELADSIASPPPSLGLAVSLSAKGEPAWLGSACEDSLELDDSGAATGFVRRTGELEATLWVIGERRIPCRTTIVEGAVVSESANTHRIVLNCDPSVLAAAADAAQLRRR